MVDVIKNVEADLRDAEGAVQRQKVKLAAKLPWLAKNVWAVVLVVMAIVGGVALAR